MGTNTKQQKLPKYRTRVNYEQTVNEIQIRLRKAGAKKIIFDYDMELPVNITFNYPFKDEMMFFSLPLRFNGVSKLMKQQGISGGDDQAINIGWRIMKDWIIAQLALVDAEIAELAEVFLPYAVTKTGETMYEWVKKSNDGPLLLNK